MAYFELGMCFSWPVKARTENGKCYLRFGWLFCFLEAKVRTHCMKLVQ